VGIETDAASSPSTPGKGVNGFIVAAKNGRICDREPNLRSQQ